jgi:two-component system, chemotaxis family, sensor kinase CheA
MEPPECSRFSAEDIDPQSGELEGSPRQVSGMKSRILSAERAAFSPVGRAAVDRLMSAGEIQMDIDRAALMEAFVSESQEGLAEMEQALIGMESRPADQAQLQVIFRAAHTLKGSAHTMGFSATAELAHVLEDLLDGVRKGRLPVTPDLVTLALRAVDVLRSLVASLAAGREEQHPQQAALRAELAARCRREEPGAGPAVVPEPAALPAGSEAERETGLRIGIGKLDHLLGLTGRLSVIHSQIGSLLAAAPEQGGEELTTLHRKSERLLLELQDWVIDARMVPLGPTLRSHLRTVRDTAVSLGKRAHLELAGEEVRVDTGIIDSVRDALTHLVRNAVDHGIEDPVGRQAQGKPAEGTIQVRASNERGRIAIRVRDDGRGFSLSKIRARARARGVAGVERLTPAQLHRLVFEHGFSTADRISEISGRGVGMDVVLRSVEALHGNVEIDSVEGQGTTVELHLPFTVSVIDGFWIEVSDSQYVIPLSEVLECVELPGDPGAADTVDGLLQLRDEVVPFFRLGRLFGLRAGPPAGEQAVILRHDQHKVGVVVDLLHGERQTVVKPLGRLFRQVPGVAGSTLCADGRVALVLDVAGLVRSAHGRGDRAKVGVLGGTDG